MRRKSRPIHSNAGVRERYARELRRMIRAMQSDVRETVRRQFELTPPDMAQDVSPSELMRQIVQNLLHKWGEQFQQLSQRAASYFVGKQFDLTNRAFNRELKEAGWSIEAKPTAAQTDAMHAAVSENVALIKSIPERYFTDIEGAVMRAYARGGDLSALTDKLRSIEGVTMRRANIIANDQMRKATAVATRANQLDVGIKEAEWMHSGGGRKPRLSHVAANGKRYDVERGCLIDGEYILPGELVNCRCSCRSIIPI